MKKSALLLLCIMYFVNLDTFAQKSGSLPWVFSAKLSATEYANHGTLSPGGQIGMMASKNLLIGLDGNLMLPFIKIRDVVADNEATVYSAYGGVLLEPIINPNRVLHVSFPVVLGGGLIGYVWDNSDATETDFHLAITPGISLNYMLSSNLRFATTYSYRYARKISLPNAAENAFDGHNISLVLRIGRFRI